MSEDSGADDEDFGVKHKHKTMEEILADSSDDEEDEGIVDLLSPNAAQAVSATNPKTPKSAAENSKKKSDFKINSEGKLIINDDDSDEDHQKKRRFTSGLDDSDSD